MKHRIDDRPIERRPVLYLALVAVAFSAGCAGPVKAPTTSAAEVGEIRAGSGYLNGYLPRSSAPNSLLLVPPPPAPGSAGFAADEAAYKAMTALRSTPRGQLAVADANLRFPKAAEVFSCALDLPISEAETPHLNMLLRRTLTDAGGSTYTAKNHYQRMRPFVHYKADSCTPKAEKHLSQDGSYPSGHTALGWAWALVLAEIAPERADTILQRGHAFGDSRMICGVHWQSDVTAGRTMGAATVARLHADPAFRAQLSLAKDEVSRARAQGARSPMDCSAEAAALKLAEPKRGAIPAPARLSPAK